jgi:putative transposase
VAHPVGMSKTLTFDDPDSEIALFRYGLIAPLVFEAAGDGRSPSLEAQLRLIASKTYQIPHSKRTRVSLSSVRRYLAAFRHGGFESLKPHPRSDAGVPRAFDQATLDRALALRESQPDRTGAMIVEHLKRDGITVNSHTLDTHLRRQGKTRHLLNKDPKTARRFERDHPSSLWQGDSLQGPWIPEPGHPNRKRRAHLFAFIDDHSRFVPYGEWFFDEQLPRLERVLKIALLRRGLPKAIYVDNGRVFHATQFCAALATLGIRKFHSPPYKPQGRGKIERFFGTVREQFLPEVEAARSGTARIDTLALLNTSFWAWLEQVYHTRVHTETQQTPFERFTCGPGFDQIQTPDPETLRQAFLWRITRKVSSSSTIELQGNTYQVDLGNFLRGQRIELRFDPFDLTHLDIYRDGKHATSVTLVHGKRQYHQDIERLVPEQLRAKAGADFLAKLRDEHLAEQRAQIGVLKFSNL